MGVNDGGDEVRPSKLIGMTFGTKCKINRLKCLASYVRQTIFSKTKMTIQTCYITPIRQLPKLGNIEASKYRIT